MNIYKKKHQVLTKLLGRIYSRITKNQQDCPHEGLVGKYEANTGNWCASDDRYWVEFSCPDCGKRWTEDQDATRYILNVGYMSKDGIVFTKI